MMSQQLPKKLSNYKNSLLLIQVQNDLVVSNTVMDELIQDMPSEKKAVMELLNTEHDWIWDDKPVKQAMPRIKEFIG